MRIAIFGGSFDPIHSEHVRLVKDAVRVLKLDKLFVMPALSPPHKSRKLAADEDRLAMCRLAFEGEEKVTVSDYEISRGGTSYTYLTCKEFKERYPSAELFFIVGTDMLRNFPTWKNPREILNCATLAVCSRGEEKKSLKKDAALFKREFGKKFVVLNYEGKDVSSTKIRVLAGAGERLTPFVDEKVAKYIEENGLYRVPYAKEALALEKKHRKEHSLRVAETALVRAKAVGVSEDKALTAALFHDCAKNIPSDSPLLNGFRVPEEVPSPVAHQFAGAYLAEKVFGISDEEIINAVRFHTSGRKGMSTLEKLIFLADMLEPERNFHGVDRLRESFYQDEALDRCLLLALEETLTHLQNKGASVYRLTQEAYEFYKSQQEKYKNGE